MRVILATDGSQHAEEAAWLLAHLPHSDKLELTVVYVSNTVRLQGAILPAELMKQYASDDMERVEKDFRHLSEVFEGANVSLELAVLEGHVGQAIVREAEARKSELIVLGAVGHSVFERMLGSVSDYVASQSHCSVLLVRPTGLSTRKRSIDLCFAQDESPASTEAVRQIALFGWGGSTHIDVVGVVALPFVYSEIPYEFDVPEMRASIQQTVDQAAEQLRKLSPNVQTHVIEGSHAGDALVEFAKKRGSDIIVLGNSVQSRLGRFLFGSTSRYVLRHAKCSIWIARAKPS